MNSPMLSIIMSVYNGEKYLDESIQSILHQTFRDFEFIIIDDCSTDHSGEIIQKYIHQDNRIIFIQKEKNIGLKGFVENLNLGIQKSKGEFIARMDQDDYAYPHRLETQIQYLTENEDVFLIGSTMTLMNENSKEYSRKVGLPTFPEIKNRIKIDNPIFHPTIMFRNEPNLFYRDKFYACEDFDFYLRLITNGKKIENISEPLLRYRILDSSMSRKGNNFIKRLFLEKAKEFYIERVKKGNDRYESFNDEEFFKILDEDFISSKEILEFAIKTSIIYRKSSEFKFLISKYQKQFGKVPCWMFINKNDLINKFNSYYFKRAGW